MLTPLDIHKKEFRRSFRGYNEEEVDMFLDQLAKDYEEIYSTNLELTEQLEKSQSGMARYKELEDVIKETMVMAQKNADELRQNTEKETEVLLQEARVESDRKLDEARRQYENMLREAEQKSAQMIKNAEEKSGQMLEEAEAKVKESLNEYENLCSQARTFKIKFRSFLESQLQMLNDEALKNSEQLSEEEPSDVMREFKEYEEVAAAFEQEDSSEVL